MKWPSKELWHIQPDESIIAPFDTRGRVKLIPGELYKLYCKRGFHSFFIKDNEKARSQINNQSILLFLSAEEQHPDEYHLNFFYDNKIVYYLEFAIIKEKLANFILVT